MAIWANTDATHRRSAASSHSHTAADTRTIGTIAGSRTIASRAAISGTTTAAAECWRISGPG